MYFTLTEGKHPFGNSDDRNGKIKKEECDFKDPGKCVVCNRFLRPMLLCLEQIPVYDSRDCMSTLVGEFFFLS
jgi:hypothetical protein